MKTLIKSCNFRFAYFVLSFIRSFIFSNLYYILKIKFYSVKQLQICFIRFKMKFVYIFLISIFLFEMTDLVFTANVPGRYFLFFLRARQNLYQKNNRFPTGDYGELGEAAGAVDPNGPVNPVEDPNNGKGAGCCGFIIVFPPCMIWCLVPLPP